MRSRHRRLHVLLASFLGVFLYSPLRTELYARRTVQLVVFPSLALSGILLWYGHRIRDWRRDR